MTVMLYKTHRGIHNFGACLALGGRADDGYKFIALQFFGILFVLLVPLSLAAFVLVGLGMQQQEGFYAFLPWDLDYCRPLGLIAVLAFVAIVLIRVYLYRRLWPAQMILYRE